MKLVYDKRQDENSRAIDFTSTSPHHLPLRVSHFPRLRGKVSPTHVCHPASFFWSHIFVIPHKDVIRRCGTCRMKNASLIEHTIGPASPLRSVRDDIV